MIQIDIAREEEFSATRRTVAGRGPADEPMISVIIACYNGAAFVEETVASVLRQSFDDFEIIMVDDCSTDETMRVLRGQRDPRIRVLSTPHNMGPAHARNLAFGEARGRYLAALDQDDLCHPDRFRIQTAYLDANAGTVAVGTAACHLTVGGVRRDSLPLRTTPGFVHWMLHMANPLVWSSMMIRGDAARTLGSLNRADYMFAEDYDLYHRLTALGEVARLDQVLTVYRCHPGGASERYRAGMRASAKAVLAHAYEPWFGDTATWYAGLVVDHLAGGEAVPGEAVLRKLGEAIGTVRRGFDQAFTPDAASRVLMDAEMSRLWWRAARTGLRTGTLSARQVRRQRPDYARRLGLGAADRLASGLIGRWRAYAAGSAA